MGDPPFVFIAAFNDADIYSEECRRLQGDTLWLPAAGQCQDHSTQNLNNAKKIAQEIAELTKLSLELLDIVSEETQY